MRNFVFTERDRRLLEEWIAGEEETQDMRKLISQVRRSWLSLAEDMELLFKTIKAMQRRRRWRGRLTVRSEFGSALRRAESALTLARRGGAT